MSKTIVQYSFLVFVCKKIKFNFSYKTQKWIKSILQQNCDLISFMVFVCKNEFSFFAHKIQKWIKSNPSIFLFIFGFYLQKWIFFFLRKTPKMNHKIEGMGALKTFIQFPVFAKKENSTLQHKWENESRILLWIAASFYVTSSNLWGCFWYPQIDYNQAWWLDWWVVVFRLKTS